MGNFKIAPINLSAMPVDNGAAKHVDKKLWSAKEMPIIYSDELGDTYPGKKLRIRFLPTLASSPHAGVYIYEIKSYDFYKYNLGKIFLPLVNSEMDFNEKDRNKNPIAKLRSDLYNLGTEYARNISKTLYPKSRYFANVIIRQIPLNDDNGVKRDYSNIGPKIFSMPKSIYKFILEEMKDNGVDPFDIDHGADLLLKVERSSLTINGKKFDLPKYQYNFCRDNTPLGTEEQLSKWLEEGAMYDLTKECAYDASINLQDVADKLKTFIEQNEGIDIYGHGSFPSASLSCDDNDDCDLEQVPMSSISPASLNIASSQNVDMQPAVLPTRTLPVSEPLPEVVKVQRPAVAPMVTPIDLGEEEEF